MSETTNKLAGPSTKMTRECLEGSAHAHSCLRLCSSHIHLYQGSYR